MDIGAGATILVNVELNGVEQGKAALNAFGTVGEQSANRVREAYKQVAASAMDFARAGANANQIAQLTGSSIREARDAVALYAKTLATAEDEVRGLKAANQELAEAGLLRVQKATTAVTTAATAANPALNSVRASMTAMAASALQTFPGVAQVASALGNFALGAGPMVAVLAGIAAVTVAWKAFTDEARKARDEQEKLTTSLLDWYDKQKLGAGGEFPKQIDAMIAKVKELRGELEKMNGGGVSGIASSVGAGGSRVMAWVRAAAGFLGSGNTVQLAAEMAKGAESTVAAIDKGGKAIIAAREELAKRLNQQTLDQMEAMRQLRESQYTLWAQQIDPIVAGLKKLEVAYSGLTAKLLAAERAGNATSQLWREMQASGGVRAATLPGEGVMPTDAIFALPSRDEFRKYNDDIARIWSDGIGRMLTDGLKSYHDFFEDVLQMFSSLMKRMEQEGRASGLGGRLLGIASAGIGGGIAGYQTGLQAGSPGLGALGGAGAGAIAGGTIGSAVPVVGTAIGAVVGSLVGLTAGLIGGAKAAHDRAMAEEELRRSLSTSLEQMRVLVGTATPLSLALKQNADAFRTLREQTEAAYAGRKNEAEREKTLRELTELETKRAQQIAEEAARQAAEAAERAAQEIRDLAQAMADAAAEAAEARRRLNLDTTNDLRVRLLSASGDNDAVFYLRQQLEWLKFIDQDLDPATLALAKLTQQAEAEAYERSKAEADAQRATQEQTNVLQQQQQTLQQQLGAQQEIVNNTRQTIDALRKYSDSLKLGNLTPLGPEERYNEARRQYLSVANLAAGGDVTAAGNLPGAANAFLEQSRNMFASTDRYRQDFQQVQAFVGSLIDQYGAQLTVEERMLAQLQAQNAALQAQLELQRQIKDNTESTKNSLSKVEEYSKNPPWLDKLRDDLLKRPPSTDPPVDPRRRPPDDRIRTNELLTGIHAHLSDIAAKSFAQLDVVGRTHGILSSQLPTQTEYQRQTSNNTRETTSAIRERPIGNGNGGL